MSLLRWTPTFLAFPLGGLLAMVAVGSVTDLFTALAAGVIAGAVIATIVTGLVLRRILGARNASRSVRPSTSADVAATEA